MTKRLLICVVTCLLPFFDLAVAQQAPRIRSGEHPTYSRLVIPVPEAGNWEFTVSGRRAQIVVPGNSVGFDVSAIFDRIPKTRVLSVTQRTDGQSGFIDLAFACDCQAKASVSGQSVIIDVFDQNVEEERVSATSEAGSDRQTSANEPEDPPRQRPLETAEPLAMTTEERNEEDLAQLPEPNSAETGPLPDSERTVDDVAAKLIEQLERAADQGFVELQEPENRPTMDTDPTEPNPEPPTTSLRPFAEDIDGMEELAARLRREMASIAENDFDGAVRLQIPDEVPSSTDTGRVPTPEAVQAGEETSDHCLDDEYYRMDVLNASKAPITQIIELRGRLIGEFDQPDSVAADELTRLYIALGMGVEARAVANEFLLDDPMFGVLNEFADITEGHDVPVGGELDKTAGCPGPAAMWRTAGLSNVEDQPISNTDEIVAQLADLPVELRRQVAPKIVASFVKRGQLEAAQASFAVLERAAGNHGSAHEFQRASLLAIEGKVEAAEAILSDLAKMADPIAPKALIELANSFLSRGRIVPPEVVGDLASMARQFRNTPINAELRRTEIFSRAGNGQFANALSVLKSEMSQNRTFEEEYVAVADAIFRQTKSTDLEPGEYATAVFEHMDLLELEPISLPAKLSVAKELIEIGLPSSALELTQDATSVARNEDVSKETRVAAGLLAARALIAMDQPQAALNSLPESKDPQVTEIRLRAHYLLGQHADALDQAHNHVPNEDLASFGWRAGRWDLVAGQDNFRSALANFMLEQTDSPTNHGYSTADPALQSLASAANGNVEVSLQQARQLGEQSESVRFAISSALSE